ncbi:ABC transporter permease [Chitinophaga caeni]|uniref:ABC transporter permease n=1 Tax=Chitinophaga caeni TaxID=2029983 RepID=A0A291QZ21_9BACT|nr:MlaD family protein [Chitinophaga caeni]ATL49185.1 ABC transporter permease [Chitinophaga caeni]
MKASRNRKAVVVGIFIFTGILIFAVAVLVLGGQQKTFISSVSVKADFDDVGGLSKGDNIWYSGVKVGTVKKIAFSSNGKITVSMDIEKSSKDYIHNDVIAKISTDGLVGNKIIALAGGTRTSPVIKEGDMIRVATNTSSDELMNTLQVNNKNLVEITGNLKTITKNLADGKGSIGKILQDESLYDNLNFAVNSLKMTSEQTRAIANNLADYTRKLNQPGVLANKLVTDTTVFSNLQSMSNKLQLASDAANETVNNLNEMSRSLNTKLQSSQSAAGVLLNDSVTAKNLQSTISNLESTTEKLDVNMTALRSNFLFRRYFKKLDKQKKKEEKQREKDSLRALKN